MDANGPPLHSVDDSSRVTTVVEVALPGPRRTVRQVAAVGRRREIQGAICGHIVYCLRNHAVLENRFGEITYVIDDDVASVYESKTTDIISEASLPCKRRGKKQFGSGCKVMDDLHHCRALIRTVRGPLLTW